MSPSLRGSGLKSVSLFTREWIEIVQSQFADLSPQVSLFTREWIEIKYRMQLQFR